MKKRYVLFFALIGLLMFQLLAPTLSAQETMNFNEAPMLAELVEAGELPPVEERLPVNPLVIDPVEAVGNYGGTFEFPFEGTNPGWGGLWFVVGWEHLVSWETDFSGVRPNIAESFSANEDATTFTFTLREGMRWSDGMPFTVDDIVFAIDDIWLNEELNPTPPTLISPNGEAPVVERIDDLTFSITFTESYGLFPEALAQWPGWQLTFYPKHWLQDYHIDYNPDGIDELIAADDNAEDWVTLFNNRATGVTTDVQDFFMQPDRPVLHPWVVEEPLGTGTSITLARNPYYWKVDTDGNQLPYFDDIVGDSFQDYETRLLSILDGEYDIFHNASNDDRALLFQTVEDSGMSVELVNVDSGNVASIHFNRTLTNDDFKAEVFANRDFRVAMSHAINRQEVIDILYFGQGEPAQVAPVADSPLYNEQLATQYLEYDVERANELLDTIMPERNDDGFRLRPDGDAFQIVISAADQFGQPYVALGELLTDYWEAVGVDVVLDERAPEAIDQLLTENTIEVRIFTGEGGAGQTPVLDPRYYVPNQPHSTFVNAYALWYNDRDAAGAVEPPQWVEEQVTLYESARSAPTVEERLEIMSEVLQFAADEFYVIGIARPAPGIFPIGADIGNFPDGLIIGWIQGVEKLGVPEVWYRQ